MGLSTKTDKLDAGGLATLLHNGTLPQVWIAPAEIRDQRELLRTRMKLRAMATRLKNQLHGTLSKYNLNPDGSDLFAAKQRERLQAALEHLPPHTQTCAQQELELLDTVEQHCAKVEERIWQVLKETPEAQLLTSLPGVGKLLAMVIASEVGDVKRFRGAPQLASYAGVVPRVHASGDRTRRGPTLPDANRYLKCAYAEAANAVALNASRWQDRHAGQLYLRLRDRKGHGKAAIAVARHLAEASYWILTKREPYRDPRVAQRAPDTPASAPTT
jgi:transposase